jgi:serine/threonine protein kinase
MLMERLDAQWTNLAGPPSLETCTRDVYSSLASWPADVVLKMAHGLALALTHIHERCLVHGDVYAHNVLHDGKGGVRLGDFGAATLLPLETSKLSRQLQAFDVRALGCLLQELNARCSDLPGGINAVHQACDGCLPEDPLARPRAHEVAALLAKAGVA